MVIYTAVERNDTPYDGSGQIDIASRERSEHRIKGGKAKKIRPER